MQIGGLAEAAFPCSGGVARTSKFGITLKVVSLAQAFAQFADPGSCAAAKAAIHGRMFAGETIRAQYVTPQYFAQLPR